MANFTLQSLYTRRNSCRNPMVRMTPWITQLRLQKSNPGRLTRSRTLHCVIPGHTTLSIILRRNKDKGKVGPLHAMDGACGERRYSSYSLTSALEGGEWSVSMKPRPRFTPGTHCTVGWVGPRAGMDAESREKILYLCRESKNKSLTRIKKPWTSVTGEASENEVRLTIFKRSIPTSKKKNNTSHHKYQIVNAT
jgi:hypothetical protein